MKKICVVTATRAEYGLLKPLMKKIDEDKDLLLQIIVTGMHLSPEFGYTYEEIIKDGFTITEQIEILLSSDTAIGTSKSMGLAIISFSETFERLKPDMVIILGDRFEMMSIAISALNAHIPIAHLYGGETTEGAIDEAYRHAITKMSYLHFTSTETYRNRVIQMGESPDRVFNVGALAIEVIKNLSYLNKADLENFLGIKLNKTTALLTYHPVTLEENSAKFHMENILQALDEFDDLQIIFTKANSDMYGRSINQLIDNYVKINSHKSVVFSSLGQIKYLSCMKVCNFVVGNSSSGIIEAPNYMIPTVNIGDRQKGRVAPLSIINCEPVKNSIVRAIKKALSKEFKELIISQKNPYGDGKASEKIKTIIKEQLFNNQLNMKKQFYDLDKCSN